MRSRKTSVELNEDLLEAVQQILATRTVRETIEQAFREIVRAEARRDEVRALREMDGMDLADPDVMARAWPL